MGPNAPATIANVIIRPARFSLDGLPCDEFCRRSLCARRLSVWQEGPSREALVIGIGGETVTLAQEAQAAGLRGCTVSRHDDGEAVQ